MRYTIKDRSGKTREATPFERAHIRRLLSLHKQYWKWQIIRAVAFVTAVVLLIQIFTK